MSHNNSSSDHQKSRNLSSLQVVTSVILWKLCITIMPTQDECVCVCCRELFRMDELSDFNIHTVYHPGFSYVCLDPWDLQAAYIHVLSVSTATWYNRITIITA